LGRLCFRQTIRPPGRIRGAGTGGLRKSPLYGHPKGNFWKKQLAS
jgi:hypothetical protein